jgi:hypothetical protein
MRALLPHRELADMAVAILTVFSMAGVAFLVCFEVALFRDNHHHLVIYHVEYRGAVLKPVSEQLPGEEDPAYAVAA